GAEDSFNVSAEKPAGNGSTFNGFSEPAAETSTSGGSGEPAAETLTSGGSGEPAGGGRRIDYVFVSPGMEVLRHRTERVKQDSVYISDHWPVIVTLKLL
ncbi:MAG: hypothetical protein KFF49_12955, partial [Bacteroidales bacterium]|nr:hypothetical protein [Bacteroidales bacterium]